MIVWLVPSGPGDPVWVLGYLVPLEGAARWGLPGGLIGAGLFLEEASPRDFRGALASIVTSYLLVPYQGWAAMKGFLEPREGGWVRTPKTGRLTAIPQSVRAGR